MSNGYFCIGMDLGSYKTSVAASNGRRAVLQTVVGWPQDHVAETMLGTDVVFGEDVWKHRSALEVIRPLAKAALKYNLRGAGGTEAVDVETSKKAVQQIVAHAVAQMKPPGHDPVYGVIGAPSRANVENKRLILEAAAESFDAVMITPEPFTVAYGMNRLHSTLVIDIGAGTTDLCPMLGRLPTAEEQVTIGLGGDVIDETLAKLLAEKYPDAQVSPRIVQEIKERYGFVGQTDEPAIVTLSVKGVPQSFDVTEPLREACQSIVGPILAGLRELIGRIDPDFQRPLLENVLLSGGGSRLKGLERIVAGALAEYGGGRVTKVYDSDFAGAAGALKLAMDTPMKCWREMHDLDRAALV